MSATYEKLDRNTGGIQAGTVIKTTSTSDGEVQHVIIDSTIDAPTYTESVNDGLKSVLNSSTDVLSSSDVFTGTGEDVTDYSTIQISVNADQVSAANGLAFQFKNGGDWITTDEYTYKATGVAKTYSIQTIMPMFRVQYTNGPTAQSAFDLCVQYKKHAGVTTSHRVADNVSGQDDAALTKTILMAEMAGGTTDVYTNINATTTGNLKISLEEIDEALTVSSSDDNTDLDSQEGIVAQSVLHGRISATEIRPLRIDASTHSMQTIDYEHHEIHGGNHYFIEDVVDLPINDVFDMQWTTADVTEWDHFTFELNVESETEWYIYEGATINTPGTTLTPRNNNRNYADNANATVASIQNASTSDANDDTDVSAATELAHGIVGAGRNGGVSTRDKEIVLKQNTVYCFRSNANAAGYINFFIGYYQHTDKD